MDGGNLGGGFGQRRSSGSEFMGKSLPETLGWTQVCHTLLETQPSPPGGLGLINLIGWLVRWFKRWLPATNAQNDLNFGTCAYVHRGREKIGG